jgi:hypothetical protein
MKAPEVVYSLHIFIKVKGCNSAPVAVIAILHPVEEEE